jgi:uncharacterized protein DUF4154
MQTSRSFPKARKRLQLPKEALRVLCFTFHRGALLFIIFTTPSFVSPAPAQELNEYQVKAAFLFNFTKFIKWPEESQRDAHTSMRICVIGDNPFGDYLNRIIQGKTFNDRPIVAQYLPKAEDGKACSIAFVSASEKDHLQSVLDTLNGTGVLTVADTPGFVEMGGVINLFVENHQVRFEINVDAAKRARLKISSKLLSIAVIVRSKGSVG